MNDAALNRLLKMAQEPALAAEDAADFPRRVLTSLSPQRERPTRAHWQPIFAWGAALMSCALVACAIIFSSHRTVPANHVDLLADVKLIDETLAVFPHRLRAIVRDERGVRLVLSDAADVAVSEPVYMRICDGQRCVSAVTFSGQEVQVGGQQVTVLREATGGIIVAGDAFVWSSGGARSKTTKLKIEARTLGAAAAL